MDKGFIMAAAAGHAEKKQRSGLVLCGLCVVVLLFHATYIYNWVLGPFPITAEIADFPGKKQFVQADGNLLFSGISDKRVETLSLFRGAIQSSTTKAGPQYQFLKLDDRVLVVRTEPDFSGGHVEGRMVPLPNSTAAGSGKSSVVLPYMLDATGTSYRWDFDLFFLGTVVLFPVGIFLYFDGRKNLQNFNTHSMFAPVRRYGTAFSVARKAEQELLPLGESAGVGPLYIGATWIVSTDPQHPFIANKGDIAAFGKKVKISKRTPPVFSVELYVRDVAQPVAVKTSNEACDMICARLATDMPWAVVSDIGSFNASWKTDMAGCARAADSRKTAAAAAHV